MHAFPHWHLAPVALLASAGHCGPLAVWLLLKHFRKRTSADRIIRGCRHSAASTYTIAVALTLRGHGLRVDFRSEPDPAPTPIER